MPEEITEYTELPVTFNPALYLQRRAWIFEIMRRERVSRVSTDPGGIVNFICLKDTSVFQALDMGCGEGEILACLCNPAPWLSPQPLPESLLEIGSATPVIQDDHIHLKTLFALDISPQALKQAVAVTAPSMESDTSKWHNYIRWEPLEVKLWEGGLESYNAEFVNIECIICTEVYVTS